MSVVANPNMVREENRLLEEAQLDNLRAETHLSDARTAEATARVAQARANAVQTQAYAVQMLIDTGAFRATSIVEAVTGDNLGLLVPVPGIA